MEVDTPHVNPHSLDEVDAKQAIVTPVQSEAYHQLSSTGPQVEVTIEREVSKFASIAHRFSDHIAEKACEIPFEIPTC